MSVIRKSGREPWPMSLGSGMNSNAYQNACLRTLPADSKCPDLLLMGLMGLNGEAGECIDIYKKVLFQDHELDREHLAKELGDVAWYLAVSAYELGYDLGTIFRMNIDKLEKRYPDGFTAEASMNRDAGDV